MTLRQIIRNGYFYGWGDEPEHIANLKELVGKTQRLLVNPRTILVNAQSVMDDAMPASEQDEDEADRRMLDFAAVPRPKPPFEWMWLEATMKQADGQKQRIGCLTERIEFNGPREFEYFLNHFMSESAKTGAWKQVFENVKADRPKTYVKCAFWSAHENAAMFNGAACYWLDEAGNFMSSFRQCPQLPEQDEREYAWNVFRVKIRQGWALQTFGRMNCDNVELRAIPEGKARPHAPNKVVPATVWHEIVITSEPKIRYMGKGIFERDESEIRAHWIRGHYADYRKGNGLFGRIHGVFWIPEHRRGNEELGQVIPEYTIQ